MCLDWHQSKVLMGNASLIGGWRKHEMIPTGDELWLDHD